MREPTTDECSTRAEVQLTDDLAGRACWYPTMGGYVGRCVVVQDHGCVDVYVWHDGEFPFTGLDDRNEYRQPKILHHCNGAQFVQFGRFIATLTNESERYPDTPAS